MGNFGGAAVAIAVGIIGLAMVAVIVSKNAQAPAVLGAAGSALAGVIGAAVSPVSGGNNFGASRSTIGGISV